MDNIENQRGGTVPKATTFAEARHQLVASSQVIVGNTNCWRRVVAAGQLGELDERLLSHVVRIPGPENIHSFKAAIDNLSQALDDIEAIRKGVAELADSRGNRK